MNEQKFKQIDKKTTWEKLPQCPMCGYKISYGHFTRNLKNDWEMGAFDKELIGDNDPVYNTTHHNQHIFVKLAFKE